MDMAGAEDMAGAASVRPIEIRLTFESKLGSFEHETRTARIGGMRAKTIDLIC